MIDRTLEIETDAGAFSGELKELAMRCASIAVQRISEESKRVTEYAAREPARALGIALGVGVFIGWMIRRR
jgi:ElaB/YqjD/DUF883 family membrane-anchored ribosome-binding protein